MPQWGSYGTGEGEFNMPWGIAVDDEGDVYVADWRNDRIQKFSADGTLAVHVWHVRQCDNGQFNRPTGVAVDMHGDIYVADWGNNRVQLFNPEGRYVKNSSAMRRSPRHGARLCAVESEAVAPA